MDVGAIPTAKPATFRRPSLIVILSGVTAVGFVAGFALPYLSLDAARFDQFWPRRWWLVAHLVFGIIALLLAPVQIWLGTTRQRLPTHRQLGWIYMATIAASAVASAGLIVQNDVSWLYGVGLTGLAAAWLTTTAFAFVAIRRRKIELHREWMTRSAVITFAFVWFRIALGGTMALDIGTMPERFAFAAWSCWSIPLLVTEVIIQRKRLG
jgi:uncharacterized membrane protein